MEYLSGHMLLHKSSKVIDSFDVGRAVTAAVANQQSRGGQSVLLQRHHLLWNPALLLVLPDEICSEDGLKPRRSKRVTGAAKPPLGSCLHLI